MNECKKSRKVLTDKDYKYFSAYSLYSHLLNQTRAIKYSGSILREKLYKTYVCMWNSKMSGIIGDAALIGLE